MAGKVYIIGVGPGDPKLATLKAVECIAKADVVIYDRLVGGRILAHARKDAELVYVGKMPDYHAVPQDGINDILVEKALEGKTVARVKGGDPFVFGRGGEEAEALYEKGIEFEIVPGVTSAIAVPAYAGIPVTHRDHCSSFHVITGHERPGKDESSLDYKELAALSGTLVFLMGVKNLQDISDNLVSHGKDGQTPAAVIEKGTTQSQRKIIGTLENIAAKAAEAGVKSPAITVIGHVVTVNEKLDWFPKGRLAGKRIIVTRAREQASRLVEMIEELGGEALEYPTIKITGPEDYRHFDSVLGRLNSYGWIVFTSVNGVKAFFDRMKALKMDIRALGTAKLAAVGEATGAELEDRGLTVDCMPERYTTEELLKGFPAPADAGEKVLLARADIAAQALTEGLAEKGFQVEDLVAYRTVVDSSGRDEMIKQLKDGEVDYVTFTSSSTVKNFVSILGSGNMELLPGLKAVCIGPVTAKTAEENGIKGAVMAETYTIEGVAKKLLEIASIREVALWN